MDQLNVEMLKSRGGFVGAPVRRTVEWTNQDGEEFSAEVYVRPLSYHESVTEARALTQGDNDFVARRIANTICHSDGSPVFMVSDITGVGKDGQPTLHGPLCKSLTDSLLVLIAEVNGLGKPTKASLTPKNDSGTNSSLPESEAEQSKKPSKK